MPNIVWRPVQNLPASRAQDGHACIQIGGKVTDLTFSIRPGRTQGHGRGRSLLSLSICDRVTGYKPTVKCCKSAAESILSEIIRHPERGDLL